MLPREADRTFGIGKGGLGLDPKKTCLLFIEFQNEFATPGGKLHLAVKDVMESNNMLENSSKLAKAARKQGIKVFHAPITFHADQSDNPNRYLGILGGVDMDDLFVRGTWNGEICDAMKPEPEDVIVVGKNGLSAFPNTTLDAQLKEHGIESIALGGFMSNCCVESTMREACEKGYNVVTLTDCVATTSFPGQNAAVNITYPFFSTPMNAESFLMNITETNKNALTPVVPRPAPRSGPFPKSDWAVREIGGPDLYQFGPWFVDVRQCVFDGKKVTRNGAVELRRYLTFAYAATGCSSCDKIYAGKMPAKGESTEAFGWLCNMTVGRLPTGGCVLYSPILSVDNTIEPIVAALEEYDLLPVRAVIAPSPQHHLTLAEFQERFPDALFICGKASGQMPPLTRKRRDLKFGGVLSPNSTPGGAAIYGPPVQDAEGAAAEINPAWEEIRQIFHPYVVDDNRTGEIVLLHRATKTLIMSDLLYKSNPDVVGPGGKANHYSCPDWFAQGQEELFYSQSDDNSGGLLPSYRTHPRARSIDISGMRKSLEEILSWDFDKAVACHIDPLEGPEAKEILRTAWGFVWPSK